MQFSDLPLAKSVAQAVAAAGYTTPTDIQAQAIPPALEGHDVLGCAQTGTGKTAAFALPVLTRLLNDPQSGHHDQRRGARALVLSPTRELAKQIDDSFRAYGKGSGLRGTVIYGGVGQNPQVDALRRGVDVVIATPGRLCDLMNQRHVDLRRIEIFVLDEADRMLDMGFLPDVQRIIDALPEKRQTLFFSATMPREIEDLVNNLLHDPVRISVAPEQPTVERIDQSVCFIDRTQKMRLLVEYLRRPDTGRSIVFTRTKHGADKVTRQLLAADIRAEAIHGNKSQNARQRTLLGFRAGYIQVLVATDLAARGIDVDGITHVFNYDLPHEPETYVHRIGRTARAGASGHAISFCGSDEKGMLRGIERMINRRIPVARVPDTLPNLPRPLPSEPTVDDLPERRPARGPGRRPVDASDVPPTAGARRPPRPANRGADDAVHVAGGEHGSRGGHGHQGGHGGYGHGGHAQGGHGHGAARGPARPPRRRTEQETGAGAPPRGEGHARSGAPARTAGPGRKFVRAAEGADGAAQGGRPPRRFAGKRPVKRVND